MEQDPSPLCFDAPESPVTQGVEWLLWMDDDAIFTDMNTFPFDVYDEAGVNVVIWGDPQRVFRANDIQGLNTGVFLLRKCEWSRQLMAEVAALATPSIRRQIGNKGRIAEQGALTWVLHSQASKWKDKVLLERNFTMNGNWMDYAGKWVKGRRVGGSPSSCTRLPNVPRLLGERHVARRRCHHFLERTFGDDQVLNSWTTPPLDGDAPRARQRGVRALPAPPAHDALPAAVPRRRHAKGRHVVVSLATEGGLAPAHPGEQRREGDPLLFVGRQLPQGSTRLPAALRRQRRAAGQCAGDKVRGEVSATYLDYRTRARGAAAPSKIVILLRELSRA